MSRAPLLDPELVTRRVQVAAREVVYVRALLEASEGLGALFAERGGDLWIVAHPSRARELDDLLADLAREIQIVPAVT